MECERNLFPPSPSHIGPSPNSTSLMSVTIKRGPPVPKLEITRHANENVRLSNEVFEELQPILLRILRVYPPLSFRLPLPSFNERLKARIVA